MTVLTDDTLPAPERGIRDEMIVFAVMAAVPLTGIYPFFVMQAVCTENPIQVYRMIESAKLAR
jgi:branched-chain amino acid transport system permease protein